MEEHNFGEEIVEEHVLFSLSTIKVNKIMVLCDGRCFSYQPSNNLSSAHRNNQNPLKPTKTQAQQRDQNYPNKVGVGFPTKGNPKNGKKRSCQPQPPLRRVGEKLTPSSNSLCDSLWHKHNLLWASFHSSQGLGFLKTIYLKKSNKGHPNFFYPRPCEINFSKLAFKIFVSWKSPIFLKEKNPAEILKICVRLAVCNWWASWQK